MVIRGGSATGHRHGAVFSAAALASIPAAHADSAGDAMAPVLNGAGIGNNGPVSSAIAQMGQSICPMLVKPGGSLASNAAQISGHGGLAPPMAGFLARWPSRRNARD